MIWINGTIGRNGFHISGIDIEQIKTINAHKSMKKFEAIETIRNLMNQSWTSNDDGDTMAVHDLMTFGKNVIDHIKSNDIEWIMSLDRFNADTGIEQDIIIEAQSWAVVNKLLK